jgi:outer membrane receptor protein involved in Fe transport
MGGNVRFITPMPSTTKTSFYARTEASFTQSGGPNTELGLAFNLPLVENVLGLRMSGYYRHDGGYVDRWDYWGEHVNEGNSNYSDIKSFRVAATWQPIENLSITPSFYWQKVFVNDSSRYWLPLSDADSNRYNRAGNIPNWQEDRFSLPGLKVQWDVGNLSFFSNTSYFDRTQPAIQDLAAFEASIWAGQYYPPPGMYAPSKEYVSQQVFTQEFRVQNTDADARLTWVGGVFYQRAKQRYIEMVQNTFLPGLILENFGQTIEEVLGSGLVDGKYTVVVDPFDTIDKHLAAFGQVDFKFTDKLKGTFGLRVERADLWSHILYSGPVNGPVPVTIEGSGSETPVTPKFGLSYQLNDGTMLYTTVAKGYRIGGVNQPISVNCGNDLTDIGLSGHPTTYGSDSLWSYELGGKFRSEDGRYALDASVYRIKWTDLQVNYNLPTCGFSFTTNAGAITSDGVELSFRGRPVDQFTFGISLGYTKASTDRDTWYGNATEPAEPGQKPMLPGGSRQLVAPYTAAVDAQYSFSAFDHDSYFRVNYNYADGLNHGLSWQNPQSGNYNPTVKGLPIRQDLTLKLGTHFGALDVALFCNNALDEHPLLGHGHATRSNPIYTAYAIRPRTLGLTASYRY